MKKIFVLLLFPLAAHGQSGDAGSGWANWIMTKVEWVKQEVRDNAAIAKTAELIKLYKETKELTGVISSTMGDLKNATLKFQQDIQNVDEISQSQLNQLNDFLSWDDALMGKGYPSLVDFERWYDDEMSTFRDNNGRLNATTLFFNTISEEAQMKNQSVYYAKLLKIRGQKKLYLDHEVRRLLRLAREYDEQARRLVIKLNWTVYKKSVGNISSGFSRIMNGKVQNAENAKNVNRSDEEIQRQIDRVYELQEKASTAKGEALQRLEMLTRMDVNSTTVDLLAWRRLRKTSPDPPKMKIPPNFIHEWVIDEPL